MGALQPSSTSSMIKALVLLSVAALVITDMLASPMPTVATTMAKGLLSLPLPPSLLLIPTTATTDFATMGTLATPTLMLVMAIITARGLLRPLPLPSPSPTMATMALAIMATLATPMPMALLSTARGLLKLPQPLSLPLILTTATTAFVTTVMLATLTLMVVTTMESKKESKCQQTKATTC